MIFTQIQGNLSKHRNPGFAEKEENGDENLMVLQSAEQANIRPSKSKQKQKA
jgi:hypothetical protein